MKNNVKVILFYVLLIAAIFIAVLAMMGNPSSNEEPIFSDIMQYFEEDRVKEFEVSSENVLTLIVYKTDKAGLLMPEDVANAKTEKILRRSLPYDYLLPPIIIVIPFIH